MIRWQILDINFLDRLCYFQEIRYNHYKCIIQYNHQTQRFRVNSKRMNGRYVTLIINLIVNFISIHYEKCSTLSHISCQKVLSSQLHLLWKIRNGKCTLGQNNSKGKYRIWHYFSYETKKLLLTFNCQLDWTNVDISV